MGEPDAAARADFIRRHARLSAPPLLPELRFWLAEEATDLWEASEAFLEETGLPPPFWAFFISSVVSSLAALTMSVRSSVRSLFS